MFRFVFRLFAVWPVYVEKGQDEVATTGVRLDLRCISSILDGMLKEVINDKMR